MQNIKNLHFASKMNKKERTDTKARVPPRIYKPKDRMSKKKTRERERESNSGADLAMS